MSDQKILSYNDVVLRLSDLDILDGPHFLNDRIIEFYFSYLSSIYPSKDILLVPPSIAFWIKMCQDGPTLSDFVKPLNLPNRKLVIFPINDNTDVNEAEGGSHWSLLAFKRDDNMFVHHDSSIGGLNRNDAKQVYKAVIGYMGSSDGDEASYIECNEKTLIQNNGYDCGLYVIAIAEVICSWYERKGRKEGEGFLWFDDLKEKINEGYVGSMRKEILKLIRSLMGKR